MLASSLNGEPANVPNLKETLAAIEKAYGKGAIIAMDGSNLDPVETISTTALSLDLALRGGIPRGRVVEILGPESSGKSTLALHITSEAQKLGVCAYIDAEHAFDPIYAKTIGVEVDDLLLSQPDNMEQGLEIANMLTKSSEVSLIVIDSVAALVPEAELAGDIGDSHVGLHARIMNQSLRILTGTLSRTNTTIIFINQYREKIGVFFGSSETTPGGKGLPYYASVILDVRRIESIKDGGEVIGSRTRVKVKKNKCAPPFQQAEFDIIHGLGISKEGCVLDLAVDRGFVKKSGAWFTYEGEQLGQGREKAKAYLKDHPELTADLYGKLLA